MVLSKKSFEVSAKFRRIKIDFYHRLGSLARPGTRELRALKIAASYGACRPTK